MISQTLLHSAACLAMPLRTVCRVSSVQQATARSRFPTSIRLPRKSLFSVREICRSVSICLKIDAPSGTALMIADEISTVLDSDPEYVYDRHSVRKKRDKKEIGISSVRGGTIVGEHEVIFAGNNEVVTISHQAQSRSLFAIGALNAAVFLADKSAGNYNMSDLLKSRY